MSVKKKKVKKEDEITKNLLIIIPILTNKANQLFSSIKKA